MRHHTLAKSVSTVKRGACNEARPATMSARWCNSTFRLNLALGLGDTETDMIRKWIMLLLINESEMGSPTGPTVMG